MSGELPAVRITTSRITAVDPRTGTSPCAVCRRDVRYLDVPIPSAYTVASIDADDPPVPVCDDCIETRYPAATWDELRAERRRFERS